MEWFSVKHRDTLSPWSGLCTPLYFIVGKSDSNVLSSQDNIYRSRSFLSLSLSLSLSLTTQRDFINLMKVALPRDSMCIYIQSGLRPQ